MSKTKRTPYLDEDLWRKTRITAIAYSTAGSSVSASEIINSLLASWLAGDVEVRVNNRLIQPIDIPQLPLE